MADTTPTLTTVAPLVLPRITTGQQIADANGLALPAFAQAINNAFASIITAFASFAAQLAINTAQEATNEAQTATNTAQLATNTALLDQIVAAVTQLQMVAGQVSTLQSQQTASTIVSSFTTPAVVLSASSDATASTIMVANHTRTYTDGMVVQVTGATLTGLAYSTTYFVYYNDPARAGGTVAYQTSLNANDSVQINGINSVGAITTPAAPATGSTSTSSTGSGSSAPGVPTGYRGSSAGGGVQP